MSQSRRRKKILDLVKLEKMRAKLERRVARLQSNVEEITKAIDRLEADLLKTTPV